METVRSVLYTVYFDVFFFPAILLANISCVHTRHCSLLRLKFVVLFSRSIVFQCFFLHFSVFSMHVPVYSICVRIYKYALYFFFLYAHILLSFGCFSLIFSIQFGSLWLNSRLLLSYFFSVLENRRNYAHHRNVFIFICIYRIWFHCVLKTIQSSRYMQKMETKTNNRGKKHTGKRWDRQRKKWIPVKILKWSKEM